MAKQTINVGSGELAGDGESLRSAFQKINSNFDELYVTPGATGPQGPQGPTGPAGGDHPAWQLTSSTAVISLDEAGQISLPGGGSIIGNNYDINILSGDDGSSSYGNVRITTNNPVNTKTWIFGTDGRLTAPGNVYGEYFTLRGNLDTNNEVGNLGYNGDVINLYGAGGVEIQAIGAIGPKWQFDTAGRLIFPDSTVQTTAFINISEGNTYYVSATGNDSNSGETILKSFKTISHALTQATAGDIIKISAGSYVEDFPLIVPDDVTLKGAGLRSTEIKPTTSTNTLNCFILNGGSTVEDLTIRDMFYDPINDTGYAFSYSTTTVITIRSPYIQRVTVLNKGSVTSPSDPYGFLAGDAGRGAIIDGQYVSRNSLHASMLFNEVTFIVPNSRGILMTNGARSEFLNCFTYFANIAIEGKVGLEGRGGDGKTYLTFRDLTGAFDQGDIITYYDTDGITAIATATIESVSGSVFTIDGYLTGFEGALTTSTHDIRSTSGGTATGVNRYDKAEFGAEMRAFSCANVYGVSGVKADGDGVKLNLIAHNFGYVGTGYDLSNDRSSVIQANEVIELNGGRVYYDTVDQDGNYRIGDLFTVNFQTGDVTLQGPAFDVTAINSINFTDGTNTTTVESTGITTGVLTFAGNTIGTSEQELILAPAPGEPINLNGSTYITGSLNVNGGRVRVTGNTPPASAIGVSGDLQGMVAFDNTYIYYCTGTYDGTTNIWKRVAWSGDTW
jgi:hypothetical protein